MPRKTSNTKAPASKRTRKASTAKGKAPAKRTRKAPAKGKGKAPATSKGTYGTVTRQWYLGQVPARRGTGVAWFQVTKGEGKLQPKHAAKAGVTHAPRWIHVEAMTRKEAMAKAEADQGTWFVANASGQPGKPLAEASKTLRQRARKRLGPDAATLPDKAPAKAASKAPAKRTRKRSSK